MKIAFFDSGVGGLTIFNEAYKDIDAEFIYFADNLNTPYGIKPKEIVKELVINNIKKIVEFGADIIVVACNTATSVAISDLRQMITDKCIIGTEPAVKVAADKHVEDKKILVCATTLTSKEEKMKNLIDRLDVKDRTSFIPLDELVKFAENLDFDSSNVKQYLKEKFCEVNFEEYSHLVLGCTHFPLFKDVISGIVPKHVEIIDSTKGVVNNVKKSIINLNLDENKKNNVTLMLTKKDENFIDKFHNITGITEFNVVVI